MYLYFVKENVNWGKHRIQDRNRLVNGLDQSYCRSNTAHFQQK